ncbi:MAG: hypothetical protein M0D53_03095 [Flavobacterium sp. JAD_PAG50586_2]|nr:MAG: hypothetical protein M0D53_03095 [Flavobacterium sp. JAD_PAG50586_2]
MKTLKIFVFCLLLPSTSAFCQYYNNGNRNGLDRRMTGSNQSTPKEPTAAEIEQNRAKRVEIFVAKLKEDLKLDDLQVVVITNEMMANSKNIEIVMKKEDVPEEKSKEIKALMEKTEVVIKSYLNKAQKEKYEVLIEELKTNKKQKKSKKKDKEKETTTEE